jgi:hypothetical protein
MALTLGYAQSVITPALDRPVYLAGFGRDRLATSVHDDLYVRAVCLQQDGTRLVLAALDLIGLARRHCLAIEARVNERYPGTRLILACTHTHHGPDSLGLWGPDQATRGVDETWFAAAMEKIAITAAAACGGSQTVHAMKTFAAPAPGFAKNARDPEIVDDELAGLQFLGDLGRPLANLVVFPCHPEVLWETNPRITADYVDSLRRDVERDSNAPCLFLAGDLGGMMTPDVRDHSFAESDSMGAGLAAACLRDLASAPAQPVGRPEFARQVYAVPMASPLLELAIGAGLLPDERAPNGALETEVNLIRLGPAWLATVPGELLPSLGLALKARLKAAGAGVAIVVGLANDELGYILPADRYEYPKDPLNPGEHYEETMSVGPEAGPRLMAAFETLLNMRRA